MRYFGNQARSINDNAHLARLQLWKGHKRRDQAMLWKHASVATDASAAGLTPNVIDDQQNEHPARRRSADFLPVDPVAVSPDGHAEQSDPTGKRDGVCMESLEQWVTRRTKEFNLMTRERPESEDVWLRFADFQEEAVRAVHGGGEDMTNLPGTRAYIEDSVWRLTSRLLLERGKRHYCAMLSAGVVALRTTTVSAT